ncbi:unnamed protein product [Brassica napus]|uniref:(rape) hypothetical protein n=1 Tax=Brassica napus TaxID=3708 RepID=A0A816LSM6_BRANA|nr:unnamed protein product [Brassica napus]
MNHRGDFDNAGAMISVGEGTLSKFLSMWIGGPGSYDQKSSSLRLPVVVVTSHESSLVARCRRVYSHAHNYHINSISNNSDGETFISADDLRRNLWNLEITNQSFNIVNVKPEKMEDLSELSSSKGFDIAFVSVRFEEPEAAGSKSFFTEIIVSVSDIKLAKEGRYLLSHDYMTLKVHMPLKLSINLFRVFGVSPGSTETATLEASRNPMRWFGQNFWRRSLFGTMSEHGNMVMEEKRMRKASSVQGHESAWLGGWSQLGNEVKFHDQSKDLIKPEDKIPDQEVLPFPMFKVSQKRDVGSSSKAVVANRMPWMNALGEKEKLSSSSNRLDFPIQEQTTQNLLELIRPVRLYATVDTVQRVSGEINLPEEDGHQLLKGSMKLKGKIFGGYLDLFPDVDHQHRGGVRLQSLESSKDTEEDGLRQNESSAETDILEMDKLQTIHLSGILKGKGRIGDSAIPRTEIPDMNEEPPLVLDGEGETSNSATQTMNVDHFLSRDCKRVRLEPEMEPSSRWVKRLKTTAAASDSSGQGETKSLMKNEAASLAQKENNNNLFLEILKSGINNLQPRNQEPVTPEINQGGEGVTLLHPWIQRWFKKKATSTDQLEGQEVTFELENQKELEKKQYPSIAAMALMGKALSGLNPYGLKKTDSLMVWNARDLR